MFSLKNLARKGLRIMDDQRNLEKHYKSVMSTLLIDGLVFDGVWYLAFSTITINNTFPEEASPYWEVNMGIIESIHISYLAWTKVMSSRRDTIQWVKGKKNQYNQGHVFPKIHNSMGQNKRIKRVNTCTSMHVIMHLLHQSLNVWW